MVTVRFNPELIKCRQQAVLVDCGNRVSALKPTKGEVGHTLENLAAAIVDPASCLCRICIRPHQRLSVPTMAPGVSNVEIMVPEKEEFVSGASLRPGDRCRECGDTFEHGIKGNAFNDRSLSLAETAFRLAEIALPLSNSLQKRMYKAGNGRRATAE